MVLAVAACGGGDDDETAGGAGDDTTAQGGGEPDKVTVQLKWVTQAQFAGYYAAQEQGYFEDEGLEVTIKPGGPDIVPEQVVLGGQAEFGIELARQHARDARPGRPDREHRPGLHAKRHDRGDVGGHRPGRDPAKLRGKKVGVWLGGNEHKLFAALTKNGLDPQKDVEIVAQPFDMNLFLNREVDAAAAMTYNELTQVLEAENPRPASSIRPTSSTCSRCRTC